MKIIIPKIVHCKKDSYTLYIGRPSKWGNPFSFKANTIAKFVVPTRQESVDRYEEYARENLWDSLEELNGKVMGCWCKPLACHGDILIKLFIEKMRVTTTDG